jgi:hypothetical protein
MLIDWFCILAWLAILRNTLKIGVPWTIGHAAVFSIAQAGGSVPVPVPVSVWLLTVVAYVLPIMYVAFLFVGQGRTPYDLTCRRVR